MQRVFQRAASAIKLIHPFPSAIVVGTACVLMIVAHGSVPPLAMWLRGTAMIAASQVAVGALNDLTDRHLDALVQPEKPIPSGASSVTTASLFVVLGLLIVILLGATFGWISLILSMLGASAGVAYDLWLKPTEASVLAYVVGFLSLVTWIWYVFGAFSVLFLLVYPAGAIAVLVAHLAQSFPDIESDRALGQRGLAVALGPERTAAIIAFAYLVLLLGTVAINAAIPVTAARVALAASVVLGLTAAITCRRAVTDVEERERLFHLVAPGVALLGVSFLLTVTAAR